MLKNIFRLLVPVFLFAVPTQAAVARTYPDALAKTGKQPIVIFLYGANYDKVSEKTYEVFVKKNKIAPYIRQTTFLEMPMYQLPSEREKKDMEKRLGDKKLPHGIRNYPCLAVVDAKGNLRGAVQDPEQMRDPEIALAALKKLIDDFYAQEKLIERAQRAKGDRRVEFLLEASDIDLRMPHGVIKNEDKKSDDPGIGNRLAFDPNTIVEALQVKDYAEANEYIRTMMAQGGYSKLQRQMMMAAYAGHLRRGGEGMAPASKERLRALYTEMRNIDPKSTYGAYAEGALVIWVEGGRLTEEPAPTEQYLVDDSGDDDDTPDSTTPGHSAMGDTTIPSAGEDIPIEPDADTDESDEQDDFDEEDDSDFE